MRTDADRSVERQAVRMHQMMRGSMSIRPRSSACAVARPMPRRARDACAVPPSAIASAGLMATLWKAKAPISAPTCSFFGLAGGGTSPADAGTPGSIGHGGWVSGARAARLPEGTVAGRKWPATGAKAP